MVSYDADDFQDVLNDASISDETMERLVDVAIDTLNVLGAETITNMNGGAPGAKTVTLTSKQHGAVIFALRQIYLGVWKKPTATTTLGQSISVSDVLANPTIVALLEKMAHRLSEVAFVVAEDTSGIE